MIFLSQRPNNDPRPMVRLYDDRRHSVDDLNGWSHSCFEEECPLDPRPEFTQTRDPEPWITRQSYTHTDRYRYAENVNGVLEWLPRHEEFDTPVNGVLDLFRRQRTRLIPTRAHAEGFLSGIDRLLSEGFTVAEVSHARRVLRRLAIHA